MRILITLFGLFAFASFAHAHELFISPNKGQGQDQQDKDEFQCIRIARDRTWFDCRSCEEESIHSHSAAHI